jgi:hypothetical protein
MKTAIGLLMIPVLVLSLATVAGAKGKKHQDSGGLSGKVVGVSPSMIIIQQKGDDSTGGSPHQIKVSVDASTTIEIDGVSGKRATDLQAGEHVVIQGGVDGPATDIQATKGKGHHHKK